MSDVQIYPKAAIPRKDTSKEYLKSAATIPADSIRTCYPRTQSISPPETKMICYLPRRLEKLHHYRTPRLLNLFSQGPIKEEVLVQSASVPLLLVEHPTP